MYHLRKQQQQQAGMITILSSWLLNDYLHAVIRNVDCKRLLMASDLIGR